MNELLPPALGVLILYVIVVPAITLVGKLLLIVRRHRLEEPSRFGSTLMYLLLVSMVMGPASWFVSAVAHLSEPDRTTIACALGHVDRELGRNALALIIGGIVAIASAVLRRAGRDERAKVAGNRLSVADPQALRLRRLCQENVHLAPLVDRIHAVSGSSTRICTLGYLRPRIEVSVELMAQLDDRALTGAMLHEAEHLRTYDPLRYLLAAVCLGLNPAAFLLRPEIARWRQARELICDRFAVRAGADPLSLAEALVVAARPRPEPVLPFAAQLGCGSVSWLQYRINLLFGYATRPPGQEKRELPSFLLIVLALVPVVLPHIVDAWPLAGLHHSLELLIAWPR